MRLLEIELRHWRGLTAQLSDLSPRLNLVLGPNESGKSRLFQALRYGLFESFKGSAQHKQALQSWQSAESPSVRIVFTQDDAQYELHKQFLKGASAQLAGRGETHRGEEAEEVLRQLIGARPGGNRGADTEHRGIWPLLTVAQGDSRKAVHGDLNEDGRGRLEDRLSREIGVAAISGAGQRLMVLAEEEYSRFFTATGQETKVLREARGALQEARKILAGATAALEQQEQTARSLAENRAERSNLEGRVWHAREQSETARARAEAAQGAASRVQLAQATVNAADQRLASAREALGDRQTTDQSLERLAGELNELDAKLQEREGAQHVLARAIEVATASKSDAEAAVGQARAALDAFHRERHRGELLGRQAELSTRIAELERLEKDLQTVRDRRGRLPAIDDASLRHLQSLDQGAREAASRLQGAAVHVVVHLRQDAVVDGTVHAAGEQLRIDVTENRRIALGELADIEVRPGGGELQRLRDAARTAERILADALAAAGATDLDRAAAIHSERTECTRQIDQLEGRIVATSPKAVGVLREELAALDAESQRLGPKAAQDQDETILRANVTTADGSLTEAESALSSANAALANFRTETAGLVAQLQSTHRERERLVAQWADRPTAEALGAVVSNTQTEQERLQSDLAGMEREYAGLGGTEVQADAQRLLQAAERLNSRLREVRSAGDNLQGALQNMMTQGHFETKEAAEAQAEQARNELSRLERQAAAARRLREVLNEERRRVVERLIAPVTARVRPYLQELFPGSELDAGETLEIVGLQSGNLKEPFTELSGGAQEQISLLTRIGLAELLAGEGTLPLVLDDVLINTDPQRIQRMHRVLFRAADRLQVMLFSCHDVLFDALGADSVFKLERQRQGGAAKASAAAEV